jgi:hypothetical protein
MAIPQESDHVVTWHSNKKLPYPSDELQEKTLCLRSLKKNIENWNL